MYDVGTGTIEQITNTISPNFFNGSFSPSVNADGTRIAFESDLNLTGNNADANVEIVLYNGDTGAITQVTNTTTIFNKAPTINADGTRVTFESPGDLTGDNPDRLPEIFVYEDATRTIKQLTGSSTQPSKLPSSNADGTRIAYQSACLNGGNPTIHCEIFRAQCDAVTCTGQPATVAGTPGNDTLTGTAEADVINGLGGNDTINALDGNDQICGDAGIDIIEGGLGNDGYDGGADLDTARFSTSATAVTANLGTGAATGAGTDTLTAIENITGSNLADTLIGNAGANTLRGSNGNDNLEGGVGNDISDGGAGLDTARFSTSTAAVTANLGTGTATGAGTDTLTTIENVTGSNLADTLTGNGAANSLSGVGGNDRLTGNAGNDNLSGGNGNDAMNGGAGADTCNDGAGNRDTRTACETVTGVP